MNSRIWGPLVLVLCLTGCDSLAVEDSEPSNQGSVSSSATASPPSARQLEAERVQQMLSPRIDSLAGTFGEGTNSPCSSATAELFTESCAEMVGAVGRFTETVLAEIKGKHGGFATLRRVAVSTRNAAEQYQKLSCGTLPSSVSVQETCRNHGAVIAQSTVDFRGGVNLGLAGK